MCSTHVAERRKIIQKGKKTKQRRPRNAACDHLRRMGQKSLAEIIQGKAGI
jgi:hypothetical protein